MNLILRSDKGRFIYHPVCQSSLPFLSAEVPRLVVPEKKKKAIKSGH